MAPEKALTTEDVVRILYNRDPQEYPVATSTYVAEQAGVSRPTALARLKEASGEGEVLGTDVGQATVWWLADDPITAKAAEDIEVVEVPRESSRPGWADELLSNVAVESEEGGEHASLEEEKAVADGSVADSEVGNELADLRQTVVQSNDRILDRVEGLEEKVARVESAGESAEAALDERIGDPAADRRLMAASFATASLAVLPFAAVIGANLVGVELPATAKAFLAVLLLLSMGAYAGLLYHLAARFGILGDTPEDAALTDS
jgi:hypothetical protein